MATEMGYGNRPPQAVDRFMKYALSIFLIVSCLFFSGKAHAASLLNITHKSDGGHTSVMLEFDSPVKFAERFVDAPSRLYLDVKQPTSATVTKSYRIESGIISAVRAGRFDKNTLRVVFDLGSMYARHIISTLSDPYRVVVDLYADNVADTENKTRTAAVEAVKAAETPKPQPPAMPVTTQPPVSAQPMPQGAGGLVPLPPALRPGTASAPGPNAAVPSLDNKTASQAAPALMPSPQLSAPPPPPASSKAAKPLVQHAGPNNVSLAFDDADIYEIAHTVFGEILKVNYLIDSRVKGRITFKTVSPIANSDVLPVMSTIFRLNGVSIMEEHGLYRIIPLTDISKEPVGVNFGKDSGDMRIRGFSMIQIVPLNSIGSKDMVEILTPFLSTGAVIKEVPGKNCLIISDTDENIQRLLQIVNIFDDDVFRDVKVELFVFKNLSVKDVVEDLRNTFPLFTAGNRDSLKIKYLPIERLNAILVVAPDEQFLRQFKKWVDIIDNVFEGAKPRIYVYPLQNSQAEHIMSILSQIFTGTGTSKSSSSQDKSTTTTTAKPTSSTSNSSLTSLMSSSTTKSTDSASTKSSSSSAVSAVTATNSILVSSETKIYYDDKLNSLIILALPKDYLYIEELIKKLDSVPRQVLIEALIIEINLSDALKYGVQWFLANKINVNNHQYTGATILEEGKAIGLVNPLF
ncbi:MAG: AMIN domain-containing protein, partial [Candidatus Magnetominusculus sp. LBB02]|nr:AMIN domain-containing protein [Candidatus Magnetominusculus sp. LBB02]